MSDSRRSRSLGVSNGWLSTATLMSKTKSAGEQALFVFDINVAVESQPLETPKLLERLESLIERDYLSDKRQLVPLLRDLTEHERVPLVARTQAPRLLA